MAKIFGKWKKLSVFARAFAILALVFFLVGLGTLGSVQSTGGNFELSSAEKAQVIFRLEKGENQKRLKQIYINVGAIYNEVGSVATLRMGRSTSATGSYSIYEPGDAKIANLFQKVEEGKEKDEKAIDGAVYNWIAPFDMGDNGISLDTYKYYKLTARTCNVVVNEVVFVADDDTVVKAEIDAASVLPYGSGETAETARKRAEALLDRQYIPSLAQSSFFRFGEEEVYSMLTADEIRAGNTLLRQPSGAPAHLNYHADKVYGALGNDLLTLGVSIFGRSPFGLRVFPFLASFGVLVFGFLFVKSLTKSDKAGFAFALLYALCGLSLGFGHLGTPLTMGLFFFTASLYACYGFYSKGLKKINFKGVLPLLLSGLSAAAAICVHGAFAVPVVGVIGLFAAGMVRQQKAKNFALDKAIAEAEALPEDASGEETLAAKEKVAGTLNEYRNKNIAAPAVYFAALLLGALVISLIALIPMYFTYVKIYDNPASPSLNIFVLLWKSFTGGFVGANVLSQSASGWTLFYPLFKGAGELYAVTGSFVNVAALLAGAYGLSFAVFTLVCVLAKRQKGKEVRAVVRAALMPLAGLALMLVTAAFASGSGAFVFGAYTFAFMLCANAVKEIWQYKSGGIALVVCTILLGLCFAAMTPWLFSIPLPAAVQAVFG